MLDIPQEHDRTMCGLLGLLPVGQINVCEVPPRSSTYQYSLLLLSHIPLYPNITLDSPSDRLMDAWMGHPIWLP